MFSDTEVWESKRCLLCCGSVDGVGRGGDVLAVLRSGGVFNVLVSVSKGCGLAATVAQGVRLALGGTYFFRR